MTKPFRNCRYEVITYSPKKGMYSRHWSLTAARRAFREAVNNQQGMHAVGTTVELCDIEGGAITILGREVIR